jgi:hypothetical protein
MIRQRWACQPFHGGSPRNRLLTECPVSRPVSRPRKSPTETTSMPRVGHREPAAGNVYPLRVDPDCGMVHPAAIRVSLINP